MSGNGEDGVAVITNSFLRERNVLFVDGQLGPLFAAWEEHARRHQCVPPPEIQPFFRQALAAFALHCASKPKHQIFGWTLNFRQPALNLFLGGDTDWDSVAGRWFTENVDTTRHNRFYQEVVGRSREPHRSFVPFEGSDLFLAAEEFYRQSEQRPARFFQLSDDRFVMLAAHPDYDPEWFQAVTQEELGRFSEIETIVPIERRPVHWKCGCSQEKILHVLLPTYRQDPEALLGQENIITVQCPRCAARYRVTREMLEAQEIQEESGTPDGPRHP